jgi:hypothetical protein
MKIELTIKNADMLRKALQQIPSQIMSQEVANNKKTAIDFILHLPDFLMKDWTPALPRINKTILI